MSRTSGDTYEEPAGAGSCHPLRVPVHDYRGVVLARLLGHLHRREQALDDFVRPSLLPANPLDFGLGKRFQTIARQYEPGAGLQRRAPLVDMGNRVTDERRRELVGVVAGGFLLRDASLAKQSSGQRLPGMVLVQTLDPGGSRRSIRSGCGRFGGSFGGDLPERGVARADPVDLTPGRPRMRPSCIPFRSIGPVKRTSARSRCSQC